MTTRRRRLLLSSVLLQLAVAPVFAGIAKQGRAAGGLPGEYLTTFGASARAFGMGGAYTAEANDATAVYWNPAGLAGVTWKEASLLYTRAIAGSNYGFLGVAYPTGLNRTVGVSLVSLSMPDIELQNAFGENQGTTSDTQQAYYLSYGHRLREGVDAGVTAKIVRQDLNSLSAVGFGADLGLIFRPKFKVGVYTARPQIGLAVQNLVPPSLKLGDVADKYPGNVKMGLGHRFFDDRLLILGDVDFMNVLYVDSATYQGAATKPVRWRTGVEVQVHKMIVVRAGLNYKEVTAGAGLRTHNVMLDYGIGIHDASTFHRFGTSIRFGMEASAEEKILTEEREKLEMKKLANSQLINAMREFDAGNLEAAEASLRKVTETDPENTETPRLLAEIKNKSDRVVSDRHYGNALQLYRQRKYEDADKELATTLQLNPQHAEALKLQPLNRAYVLFGQRKYLEVKDALTKALERDPENSEAKELLRRIQDIIDFILGGTEIK